MSELKENSCKLKEEKIYKVNKKFFDNLPKHHKKYYPTSEQMRVRDETYYVTTSDLKERNFITIGELFKNAELYKSKDNELKKILANFREMQVELCKDKKIVHSNLNCNNIMINLDSCSIELADYEFLKVAGSKNGLESGDKNNKKIGMQGLKLIIKCINELIPHQSVTQQLK